VARVIRRDGPAALRATEPFPVIGLGSPEAVAANPPLDGLAPRQVPGAGNTAPFRALIGAAPGSFAPG
jgi:hypothetical protein